MPAPICRFGSIIAAAALGVLLAAAPDSGAPQPRCADSLRVAHHDGSFEFGYAGCCGWTQPPYYGAFGEAYDLGPGTIRCASYRVTAVPNSYQGQPADCYVWSGGVGGPPGAVLAAAPGVVFEDVPLWPEVGRNDVVFDLHVDGPFTVGYWGAWPGEIAGFFCTADTNGVGGHPYVHVAPGLSGLDPGWQHPADAFQVRVASLGLEVYFQRDPVPARSTSWGAIKTLYRESSTAQQRSPRRAAPRAFLCGADGN
ncbi:MAG: hypothetical protein GF355_17240 [Candidatus Eisenbacteria bacterium]|nr:hypothetical protein [Candidatus Eisenbacteria bacterium]